MMLEMGERTVNVFPLSQAGTMNGSEIAKGIFDKTKMNGPKGSIPSESSMNNNNEEGFLTIPNDETTNNKSNMNYTEPQTNFTPTLEHDSSNDAFPDSSSDTNGNEKESNNNNAKPSSPVAQQKRKVLTASDELIPMQKKIAPDYVKFKRHKMQLLDDVPAPPTTVTKKAATSVKAKPLSADDIKKAKFKEKVLSTDNDGIGSTPIDKKPRIMSPTARSSTSSRMMNASSTSSSSDVIQPIDDAIWNVGTPLSEEAPPVNEKDFTPSDMPGYSKRTGKAKKRVVWRPEEELEQVKEFVRDDLTESSDGSFPFLEYLNPGMRNQQHQQQQQQQYSSLGNSPIPGMPMSRLPPPPSTLGPRMTSWRKPMAITFESGMSPFQKGQESKQAGIQRERESKELAPPYFAFQDSKIPENPEEAPEEFYDDSQTPLIPYDEVVETPHNMFQQATGMLGSAPYGTMPGLAPTQMGQPSVQPPLDTSLLLSLLQNNMLPPGSGMPNMVNPMGMGLPQPTPPPVILGAVGGGQFALPALSPELVNALRQLGAPQQGQPQPQQPQQQYLPNNPYSMTPPPMNTGYGQPPMMQQQYPNNNAMMSNMQPQQQQQQSMHHQNPPISHHSSSSSYQRESDSYHHDYHHGGGSSSRSSRDDDRGSSSRNASYKSSKRCTFYNSPQGCRNGDSCPFVHERDPPSKSSRNSGWR